MKKRVLRARYFQEDLRDDIPHLQMERDLAIEQGKRLWKIRQWNCAIPRSAFAEMIGAMDWKELKAIEEGVHRMSETQITATCKTMTVSRLWLVLGEGPMFEAKK
jgi:hypothetical protein